MNFNYPKSHFEFGWTFHGIKLRLYFQTFFLSLSQNFQKKSCKEQTKMNSRKILHQQESLKQIIMEGKYINKLWKNEPTKPDTL